MGANYQGKYYEMDYAVDMVFVIDATGSMRPILDTVKNNALNFYGDFAEKMNKKNKPVKNVRIRVIAFRDYAFDKERAMMVTDFFNLPSQAKEFSDCLHSIQPFGGGDDPEDGLEALAYAIKSKWNMDAVKKRHVIVLWTDDGTHDLGFGKNVNNYPKGMAKDFDELTQWWGSKSRKGLMDEASKRLLLFTPDKESYSSIYNTWSNVVWYESEAGKGLESVGYEQILDVIANSI